MKVTLKEKVSEQKVDIKQLKMMLRVGRGLKHWQKQARNTKQRVNILNEWISTERSYIEDLKIIENSIQKPLKALNLITSDQERILFPNLKSMIDLSERLTKCLEEVRSSWHPHKTLIGQKLKGYYKFFIIYREVTTVFMKGLSIIKELKQIPEVLKIEQKLSLDLQSYIIKPVQRPPKYQLLLRQYSKALRKDHPDYSQVKEASQKYHEVNELNNQSMDKQIRAKAMIDLDRRYGGIISSRFGRQYYKQFACKSFDLKCELHSFNDMIIVLKKKKEEGESTMWKRILLDPTSYVKLKNNQKYYKNMVFLCGSFQSVHLQFDSPADRNLFLQNAELVIKNLREREDDKKRRFSQNQAKRNNVAKFKVSKWHEDLNLRVKYKIKMEITVDGTLKPRGEAFYYIKFKITSPFELNQLLVLTQNKMEEIQTYLTLKYPSLYFPRVSQNIEAIGFYDTTKNRTQIIEHRSFLYEECLNYIFRNEDFYLSWKPIADIIGLNQSFFDFASTEALSCRCSLCIELKDSSSLSYYVNEMKMLKKHKKVIKSKLTWLHSAEEDSNARHSAFSEGRNTFVLVKNMCSNRYFQIMEHIRRCRIDSNCDYYHKILSLEAHLGHMDYIMLEPEEQVETATKVNVRVRLLSIEEEFIDISLSEDRYVREIIEQIGAKNSMDNVYDWGLFLMIDTFTIQIPQDQKILNFAQKWSIQITKDEEVDTQQSFLIKKLQGVKRIGEIFFGSSKGTILFKKWLYFQPDLQIGWCKNNKERYSFLINQIYARVKIGDLALNYSQVVDLSAFYLLRNKFQKIKYFDAANIETESLKDILPGNCWPYFSEAGFKMELFLKVKDGYDELNQLQNKRNGIQIIYGKTLEVLRGSSAWTTRNFTLSSYKGVQSNDTIVSINLKRIKVTCKHTSDRIVSADLDELKYRVTTFSLFIEENDKEYRFDGVQVYDIKTLIEAYKTYRSISNPAPK